MIYSIIGSGPSGVNTALTLLQRGKRVRLFDVGIVEEEIAYPDKSFHELKGALDNPYRFFLGAGIDAIIPPDSEVLHEYPPNRNYILKPSHPLWNVAPGPFQSVLSLAQGGLGAGWGANCVSYDDDDLRDFPIELQALSSSYQKAAKRIPIAGPIRDDLSDFFPTLRPSQPPVDLNHHDRMLLAKYEYRRALIQRLCRIRLGRSRMAIVTAHDAHQQCQYCCRCLLGCPTGAIYDPVETLHKCERYNQFEYISNHFVVNLGVEHGRVCSIKYFHTVKQQYGAIEADAVILAAGAIGSGAIFLRSLAPFASANPSLQMTKSILDTKAVKIPYLHPRVIGRPNSDDSDFQFNKLILGYLQTQPGPYPRYIHGEILSLTTLMYHPLIESLPFGTRLSSQLFFRLKPALGLVTYFFPDIQEAGKGLYLVPDSNSITGDHVAIAYSESPLKQKLIDRVKKDTVKALTLLGCLVNTHSIHNAPSGGGIHYAGTLPMSIEPDLLCVDPDCRSYAFDNLWVTDGACFPSLPSKSITLSLIANAIRVSESLP